MTGIGAGHSQGTQLNRMLDSLGLPEQLGDVIGASLDMGRGDWAGYARNMADLSSGLSTAQLDGLFGAGLVESSFVPRPHHRLLHQRRLYKSSFHTPFGSHEISREQLGGRGRFGHIGRPGPLALFRGRSLERAILTDPGLRQRMETRLGGRIIPDGRIDGRITVHRFRPRFGAVPLTAAIAGNPMLGGMYNGLARFEGNLKRISSTIVNGGQNTAGTDLSKVLNGDKQLTELAKGMGMQAPLAFEDIMFLMMMKYARKKEKELIKKMNELAKAQRRRRRGYGSILGGLFGGIFKLGSSLFGGLFGGPLGSMLGGQAGSMFGKMFGAGQQAIEGSFGDPQKQSDTLKQMQLQKLMEDLKKMYEMLSNVMKSMHSMQMAAVRNLR